MALPLLPVLSAPAAFFHWRLVLVLPRDTRGAVLRKILAVVAALPPVANVLGSENALQTMLIELFPRRSVPVTRVLDRCGRPATAMAAPFLMMSASVPGRNLQRQWPLFSRRRIFQEREESCLASRHVPRDGFGDNGHFPPPKIFYYPGRMWLTLAPGGRSWVTLAIPQWRSAPSALVAESCGCPSTTVAVLPGKHVVLSHRNIWRQ